MANTYVDYVGSDGTGTDGKEFAFSFPYIKTSHVVVEINQGPAGGTNKWERTTAFTVSTSPSTRVVLDSAPNSLWKIRVLRDSDANTSLVDFANGSVLTETELDNAYLHNRYLAEEAEEGVSGGTISKNDDGQFNADGLRLENLADPDSDDDAVTKGYADGRYVDEAGDTMSGPLNMNADIDLNSNNSINNVKNLSLKTDPTSNDHAVRKSWADTTYINVNGDSMSGDLTLADRDPVNDNHAARKKYVDQEINDAITAEQSARATAISNEQTARIAGDALKVNKAGDTMEGNLNMGTKKVTNLGSPSAGADAATKTYVDNLINGVDLSVAPSFTKLSGNGSTTDFSLTFNTNGVVSTAMLVTIDGAVQDPDDYTILGGSDEIQFTSPPPNNSEILVIERGFRPKTDLPTEYDWGFVADTTVTASYTYGQI